MLDDGRPYSEVAHQIAAVRASLDGLVCVILENLLSDCSRSVEREAVVSSLEELERLMAEIKASHALSLGASTH